MKIKMRRRYVQNKRFTNVLRNGNKRSRKKLENGENVRFPRLRRNGKSKSQRARNRYQI
jgi:hypothetical protein